ncbi:MAG: fimbrillin family protein [Alistipes sp.]|nr:fimbrillin family protein [Alistipes sp.]
MKKLFLMLAAAAAVASCSKDYTIVADQGEAIEFGSFVENSTRAAVDPSYGENGEDLTAFKVWGTVNGGDGLVSIFNGDNVTGEVGQNNIWHCNVKQYWIKDAIYNFAALVNATNNPTMVAGLPTEVKGFTADGETDLLYARSAEDIKGEASGNGPVNFNFAHLLSKVKFTVKNNSKAAQQYSFKVNGITITGNSVGDVVLASKEWKNLGTPETYSVAEISVNKDTADTGEECAKELLLIPGDYTINFNVDIYNGTTKLGSQSYPVGGGSYAKTLAVGNAYNFVITVAVGEEITFSVENQPTWTNGAGGNLN